jgi:hypothetical protein
LVGLRERIVARGEESDLPFVLVHLAVTSWLAGDLEVAEDEAGDALRVATLTGEELICALALLVRGMVRAIRGDGAGSRTDSAEALAICERIGWPHGVRQARWGQALLAMTEGDPRSAVGALDPVVAPVEALGIYEWPIAMHLPDAIEAFVATGDLERAARLTNALAAWGRDCDRPWALALSARSRALLEAAAGDLESAQTAAENALVEHERLPFPFELGRAHLALGQIQRQRKNERAARGSLEESRVTFERLGARPWAERSSRAPPRADPAQGV